MDEKNLEIVANEGLEVAEEVTTSAVKSSSQTKAIAVGAGAGLLVGGLIFWGVSKLIAWHKNKKQAVVEAEPAAEPAEKSE